jgi:hypothetical protein
MTHSIACLQIPNYPELGSDYAAAMMHSIASLQIPVIVASGPYTCGWIFQNTNRSKHEQRWVFLRGALFTTATIMFNGGQWSIMSDVLINMHILAGFLQPPK